jgi:hypothetical protein
MIFYYIFSTLISFAIVLTSYFSPSTLSFMWPEAGKRFADTGILLLWITLFVKPVFVIMTKYVNRDRKGILRNLFDFIYFFVKLGMRRRRFLWITTFLFLFTHAWINVGHRLDNSFSLASQLNAFWILAGYISLAALLIGFVTSNNLSIRLFKRHRKTIQGLAYVALIFGVLHVAFLNLWEYGWYIVVLVIYIFFKLVEKKRINIL